MVRLAVVHLVDSPRRVQVAAAAVDLAHFPPVLLNPLHPSAAAGQVQANSPALHPLDAASWGLPKERLLLRKKQAGRRGLR